MLFWFARLFAAHLLADFVFQFGFIYQLKIRGTLGILLHTMIVTAITAGILALFLPLLSWEEFGLAMSAVGLTHFGFDWLKEHLKARGRYAGLMGFLGDQLSHVAVLFALSAWLLPPLASWDPRSTPWPEALLMNDFYWWMLVGLILVTYLVGFTLFYLEGQPMNSGSPVIGRYSGFVERLIVFGLLALGPLWSWALLPLPPILRRIYLLRTGRGPLPSPVSTVLGPALAVLIGGLIRLASTS
jgi:hypothetical protein